MKRIYFGLAVSVLLAVSSFPSYAGQWKQDTAGWKYENDDHTFLQNQWFRDDDGKWYYFESDGFMSANYMTPDGYVTGADGAWIEGLGQSKDQAVLPWQYQTFLGKGLDVTWSEFQKRTRTYSIKQVQEFKKAGVSHVRIRVQDDISTELLALLDM